MVVVEEEDGVFEGLNCEWGGVGVIFECNICLEIVWEVVVSVCGYLYW